MSTLDTAATGWTPAGTSSTSRSGTVRATVLPVMRRHVDSLEPTLARICSYHLGVTDEHGGPDGVGSGKLTRAALMLAAADGVGLAPQDVAIPAAALELLHNSTLIHDDLIDADELRRGRPAAWTVFGPGSAILAGDGLQALAGQMVVDDQGPGRVEIACLFADATRLVLSGQSRELAARLGTIATTTTTGAAIDAEPGAATAAESLAAYDRIVVEKTSALLECALVAPALRAGRPEHVRTALRGAGRHLGLAFQILNDVEDIWGDPAVTGKPVRGDLARRNPSAPVLAALAVEGPVGARLRTCWRSAHSTAADLQEMADLVERSGGRQAAQDRSRGHLDTALAHLGRAGLSPAARAELAESFDRIVHRTP